MSFSLIFVQAVTFSPFPLATLFQLDCQLYRHNRFSYCILILFIYIAYVTILTTIISGLFKMARKTKNFTFSLPPELLGRLKKYAQKGYVPSVNSAVKEAIESYVVQIDKEYLYRQMKEAAESPDFVDDLEATMADFSYVDYETTREKKK